MTTDKKRTVEEIKAAMRDTPQQELAPLLEELAEAEAAEKAAPEKSKGKAKDYD